jgi:hypothetical protein
MDEELLLIYRLLLVLSNLKGEIRGPFYKILVRIYDA